MAFPKTKEAYYDRLKQTLQANKFRVNPFRPIQYGLQFIIFYNELSGIIRIYDGKKGLRLDLSQLKDTDLLHKVKNYIEAIEMERDNSLTFKKTHMASDSGLTGKSATKRLAPIKDPDTIIGIDESGKGDYFGPLVVAAVHITPEKTETLTAIGVRDSKQLSDAQIIALAPKIESLCTHSLVVMANKSYNEIYRKVGNLNHLLAWAHARVLENVLAKVDCPYALSDDFGDAQLIRAKLFSKGITVKLFSRPKAESNIAVAAASILARATFLNYIQEIGKKFKFKVPKGSSDQVVVAAQRLVNTHGWDVLHFVVKQHFRLTKQLKK